MNPYDLWAVFRIYPDEAPEFRSAWTTAEAAEKQRRLDDYMVRDLEGYEKVTHTIIRYVPWEGARG